MSNSELLSQIKNAILNSKSLLEKSKNFETFIDRHLSKGFDDFSFNVSSMFELEIKWDGKYSISSEVIDINGNEQHFINFVKKHLFALTHNTIIEQDVLNALQIYRNYKVYIELRFHVQYNSLLDKFEYVAPERNKWVKQNTFSRFSFFLNDVPNTYSIYINDQYVGYSTSQFNASLVKIRHDEFKNNLTQINSKISEELKSLIFAIRNSDVMRPFSLLEKEEDFIDSELNKKWKLHNEEVANKIHLTSINKLMSTNFSEYKELKNLEISNVVEKWLDTNCDSKFRQFVKTDDGKYLDSNLISSVSDFISNNSELKISYFSGKR